MQTNNQHQLRRFYFKTLAHTV